MRVFCGPEPVRELPDLGLVPHAVKGPAAVVGPPLLPLPPLGVAGLLPPLSPLLLVAPAVPALATIAVHVLSQQVPSPTHVAPGGYPKN